MLNPDSPIPLYHQLAEILTGMIEKREILPGNKIPSENELAENYRIGRPTVRQAIDVLIRKNLLEKKKGSGTFVKNKGIEIDLFSLGGTSSAFQKSGILIKTEYLEEIKLIVIKDKPANPFNGKLSFYFSRLELAENNPVLIEDIYLNPELFPGIEKTNLKTSPLSRLVEDKYYLKPRGGKQTFGIGYPDGVKMMKLNIDEKNPVLMVNRTIFFNNAEIGIFSEIYCKTDQYVFSQNLNLT